MIEEDEVSLQSGRPALDFLQLAAADQRRRIGTVAALQNLTHNLCARAGGERLQFFERFFRAEFRNARRLCARSYTGSGVSRGHRTGGQRALSRYPRARSQVHADQKRALPGIARGPGNTFPGAPHGTTYGVFRS